MEIILKVLLMGVVGGIVTTVLWVAFFTLVPSWPGHETFVTVVFLFGAFGTAVLGLRWSIG